MIHSKKKYKNISCLDNDFPDVCYICGAHGHMDPHHIFGGGCKRKCDDLELVVHLCRSCHSEVHDSKDHALMDYLHRVGQRTYEQKIGSREQFRKDFIRSYL